MVELAKWRERFEALGINVAAMTYDDRAIAAAFHATNNLGYPLLHDEGIKHFEAYGVKNEDYKPGDSGYGIPHPGILVVSPDGIVRAKFADPGFRQRPSFEEIYNALTAE
ncbi:MAG: redoxin domain-containing protein [Proteobacteria bacterium]|nr:redoxin domain-containing protein [Pseudomonadota bacterium]